MALSPRSPKLVLDYTAAPWYDEKPKELMVAWNLMWKPAGTASSATPAGFESASWWNPTERSDAGDPTIEPLHSWGRGAEP